MAEFVVRPEVPGDEEAIRQVVTRAFETDDEARLVYLLRAGGHLDASSVATLDKTIVAHAALSQASVAGQEVHVLAPVSVDPAHQGRGAGTAVVKHVLASSEGPVVVLGDPGYYSRFGFEDTAPHGIADKTFPAPPGTFQVLRPDRLSPGTIEYAEPFLTL